MPWITPEDEPGDMICIKTYIPSGTEYESAWRGAVLSLAEVWNWTEVEGQSPQVVADAFFAGYNLTETMNECGGGGLLPVGTVYFFAGDTQPPGTLECNGETYLAVDYPALFGAIGYTYGGAGTDFKVPDLRSAFATGQDDPGGVSRGDTGGEKDVTLTITEIPPHRHTMKSSSGIVLAPPYSVQVNNSGGNGSSNSGQTGSGGAHNNMPPWLSLQALIVIE